VCQRSLVSIIAIAVAGTAVSSGFLVSTTRTQAQAPGASEAESAQVLRTPWGEPDLEGIWTEETDSLP
jgi:hypothetical protein